MIWREDETHEISKKQDLPRQDCGVPQHAAEDQTTFDQRAGCVGERIEIQFLARRIALGNDV
jgi:hypothetical protein